MLETKRQRILFITRNLPPLLGGMERLNWHIAQQLSHESEVHVVGPEGAAQLAPAGVNVQEVGLNPLPGFLLKAAYRSLVLAWRTRPVIVLAGSGLTAPLAWLASRLTGGKGAVYLHGLDIGLQHLVYRALWLPAIRHVDVVIANSRATRALAISAGVDRSRIVVVNPGVDDVSANLDSTVSDQVRAKFKLGDGPVLLSVGRLTVRKGMREFVATVLPSVAAAIPNVRLLIVGEVPKQSLLTATQSRESIELAAMAAGVAEHICFAGPVRDRLLLDDIYRSAAVHVFPVQQIAGDPEGFGMVAIEAAAHGLPTVAYATGGIVDAVEDGASGHLVPPGDSVALLEAIMHVLNDPGSMRESCRSFAKKFAWPRFGEAIRHALADRGR